MIQIYYNFISFILIALGLIIALAHAIDNPYAPDLISKFKVDEKVYLKTIETPS